MAWIGGVDGCPDGWICVHRDRETGRIGGTFVSKLSELVDHDPDLLTVDIPIGLTDAGGRTCDIAARRFIGARRSSVFPAPIRPALAAQSWEEACQITMAADERSVQKQAWNIYPKVRDADVLVQSQADMQDLVREVHPEVCFTAWNGAPMAHAKKRRAGRAERRALVDAHFGPQAFARVRREFRADEAADDDILDAFAALWTAERIAAGVAARLPQDPPIDACGLQMEMWY